MRDASGHGESSGLDEVASGSWISNWLDSRTGYRALVRSALYERVPGGARWRYVWGSTLVFAFMTQVITGLVLWAS